MRLSILVNILYCNNNVAMDYTARKGLAILLKLRLLYTLYRTFKYTANAYILIQAHMQDLVNNNSYPDTRIWP